MKARRPDDPEAALAPMLDAAAPNGDHGQGVANVAARRVGDAMRGTRRGRPWTTCLLVGIAAVAGAVPASSVIAQAGDTNTVHIVATGGPEPGTYDLTTDEPCQAGTRALTDWALYAPETGTQPSNVNLAFSPDDPVSNFVQLLFASPRWRHGDV